MHGRPGTRLLLAALLTLTALAETTPAQAPARRVRPKVAAEMIQRTYPVADLVVPITKFNEDGTQQAVKKPQHSELIEQIKKSVASESWEDLGGQGTIQFFPTGMSLIIRQSRAAHAKIERLLTELSREQNSEVTVELRVVTLSEAFFERFASEIGIVPAKDGVTLPKFLTERDMMRFLKRIITDKTTQVMQMPKVTALNRQRVPVNVVQKLTFQTDIEVIREEGRICLRPKNEVIEAGVKWTILPVISADCRSVDLSCSFVAAGVDAHVPQVPVVFQRSENTDKDKAACVGFVQRPKVSIVKLDRTMRIADRQTAVLHAGKFMTETRQECGLPILSQLPYVGRLFRNVGYGRTAHHLLVLVTPRIIVPEAVEIPVAGAPRSRGAAEESEATPRPRR